MLVLMFGLFNVITAIFLESTMKGLAADNLRVKRKHIYRARQVKNSLEHLVARIVAIRDNVKKGKSPHAPTATSLTRQGTRTGLHARGAARHHIHEFEEADPSHIMLSEGAFTTLLKDDAVQKILDELDINIGTDNAFIFHSFRKDGRGEARLPEMLDTLMKLRGDASKADLIMPTVMIGSLGDDIQEMREIVANRWRGPP